MIESAASCRHAPYSYATHAVSVLAHTQADSRAGRPPVMHSSRSYAYAGNSFFFCFEGLAAVYYYTCSHYESNLSPYNPRLHSYMLLVRRSSVVILMGVDSGGM
jgi:hypothetical protein